MIRIQPKHLFELASCLVQIAAVEGDRGDDEVRGGQSRLDGERRTRRLGGLVEPLLVAEKLRVQGQALRAAPLRQHAVEPLVRVNCAPVSYSMAARRTLAPSPGVCSRIVRASA